MFILSALLLVNILLICYTCFQRYNKIAWEYYLEHHGLDESMFEWSDPDLNQNQTETDDNDFEPENTQSSKLD